MDRMTLTWEAYYEIAKAYHKHHGDLEIPYRFRTINGYEYDENGVLLGNWIMHQRSAYKNKKLNDEQIKLLNEIGMIWDVRDMGWRRKYNLAKKYYEHHGNFEIPLKQ